MSKLPFFQMYPLDWLRDTAKLSAAAQGHWIRILCLAWNEPERGVYQRTEAAACIELGLDIEGLKSLLLELDGVATVKSRKEIVRIENRRMVRDEKAHQDNAKWQKAYRERVKSKAPVRRKMLDVRCQMSDNTHPPIPPLTPKSDFKTPEFLQPSVMPVAPDLASRYLSGLNGKKQAAKREPMQLGEPVRKLLLCYKATLGIPRDRVNWDRVYFKKHAADADELLDVFEGNLVDAVRCLGELVGEFRAKNLSFTLATIVKHAAEWRYKNAAANKP